MLLLLFLDGESVVPSFAVALASQELEFPGALFRASQTKRTASNRCIRSGVSRESRPCSRNLYSCRWVDTHVASCGLSGHPMGTWLFPYWFWTASKQTEASLLVVPHKPGHVSRLLPAPLKSQGVEFGDPLRVQVGAGSQAVLLQLAVMRPLDRHPPSELGVRPVPVRYQAVPVFGLVRNKAAPPPPLPPRDPGCCRSRRCPSPPPPDPHRRPHGSTLF